MALFGLGRGRGRASLYETMVRAYAADLFGFAYWLCRDRTLAEDLVQETCLRAWKSWHTLENANRVKQWLFAILRREHVRRLARRGPDPVPVDDDEELALRAGAVSSMPPLEVREALDRLPADYRMPLLLQVLGGFTCHEIADIMDTTEDAVFARVSRARRMMREALDPLSAQHKVMK